MTTTEATIKQKVQSYIDGALSGEIVVCRYVRLAVERHVRDLETGHERGLWFDPDEAQFAINFIQCLKHSKGEWAGQPFILEPWEAFIIWCVFGWKKTDGTRRFNTAFVSIARRNGKSTLGAAVGHKLFVGDNEQGAEIYSAATKRDQAKIVHTEAKRMVKASPSLDKLIEVRRDNLFWEATNSKYEPLGADADTTDGLNLSGAIVDELHAHKTRELWDVLETSTGSRRNPLIFTITTAGDAEDQESIYWELRDYSIKILEQIQPDDSWFGIIYTLDKGQGDESDGDDDWTDEKNWPKANPNLGVSVKLDDLRRKCLKAKKTPGAVANFRRKCCNQETATSTPWLDLDKWNRCGDQDWYDAGGLRPEIIEQYRGRVCGVGGDLSSVSDLTALVFAFQNDEDGVDVLPFGWCPRDNAIGRQRDKRVPYVTWAEMGQLFLTEGDSVDYDALRALLVRARDDWGWDIRRIGFDPNNARYLVTKLVEEDGFSAEGQVYEHLQTCNFMNDPISLTEKLILDGKIRHGGHKPLAWCLSNCMIFTDSGGRRRFDKRKVREKIDLAVGMVMGVHGVLTTPAAKRSFYEDHALECAR